MGFRLPIIKDPFDMPDQLPLGGLPPLAAPAIVPKGHGLFEEEERKAQDQARQNYLRNVYPTAEELAEITAPVRAMPEYKAQEEMLRGNKELLRQELTRSPGLDLATPLANLSDFVQTGRLGTRQPAEKPQDAATRIREWAKQLQDDQKDLSATVVNAAARLKVGTDTHNFMQALAQSQGAGMKPLGGLGGGGNPAVNVDRFVKTFQNSPNVKPLNDAVNASRDIQANLMQPGWLTDKNLISSLVETARLKPVSDRDVKAYSGNPGLLEQFEQLVNRASGNGFFRPEDRELVGEYARVMALKHGAAVKDLAHRYVSKVGAAYGYQFDEGLGYLMFAMPDLDTGKKFMPKEAARPPSFSEILNQRVKARKEGKKK